MKDKVIQKTKTFLKGVGVFALTIFLLGSTVSLFVANAYERQPQLKASALQVVYNQEIYETCLEKRDDCFAEKNLAEGLLQDFAAGKTDLSAERIIELDAKSKWQCDSDCAF